MIYITESPSKKVIGKTSLKISFQYNQQIINIIKTAGDYFWDDKKREWEVPCNKLSQLIDNLSYLDDIKLNLIESSSQNALSITQSFKTHPFDYQLDGIKWMINHPSGLLLDVPGLGKSLMTIYAAEELKAQKNIKHCLVICGINTLKTNWRKEVERHSKLDCRIIGERINSKGRVHYASVKERAEELYNPIDEFFVIVNIETLRDNKVIEAIKKSKNSFDMIVIDECHKCLDYMTEVETDTGTFKIGEIVENKYKCKVKSFNEETGEIEWKEIVDWHRNLTEVNNIVLEILGDDNKVHKIECTPDHKIFTNNRGWVEAADLTTYDDIKLDCI